MDRGKAPAERRIGMKKALLCLILAMTLLLAFGVTAQAAGSGTCAKARS